MVEMAVCVWGWGSKSEESDEERLHALCFIVSRDSGAVM